VVRADLGEERVGVWELEDLADLSSLRERADETARPLAEFLQEINEE